MNEQIEKLAKQAGYYQAQDVDGLRFDSMPRQCFEKFAELIVKETMQVVANQLPSNVYLDVADAVIKHYGDK